MTAEFSEKYDNKHSRTARTDLQEAHIIVVIAIKKYDLQVAVHVRTVAVHLAVHLVAFPRLLQVSVVDAVVGAQTHCFTYTTDTLLFPM